MSSGFCFLHDEIDLASLVALSEGSEAFQTLLSLLGYIY